MLRFLMAALAATTLLFAACGGDDAKPASKTAASGPDSTPTTSSGLEQPSVVDVVQPTSTKAPDTATALNVVAGKTAFNPKVSEYRSLATASVSAGGQQYTGVSVATLASKVSAAATSTVTIQGTRADGKRAGVLRYTLAEIGSTTVLGIDGSGHIALQSSSIDKELWLIDVTSVAFQ